MLLAIASKLLHQILDKLVDGSTTNSTTEAVARRCSVKKGVLEILQNSQGNTCSRVSFLIKL